MVNKLDYVHRSCNFTGRNVGGVVGVGCSRYYVDIYSAEF
jgi:hypothetical protein